MSKKRTLKFFGDIPRVSKLLPAMQRAKDFLDALPVDVVYSCRRFAVEIDISVDHLQSHVKTIGPEYRYKEKTAWVYANPETVKLHNEGAYEEEEEDE